jgi:hypothetical protein
MRASAVPSLAKSRMRFPLPPAADDAATALTLSINQIENTDQRTAFACSLVPATQHLILVLPTF